jgi:putative N-acetyltransferase (TIGR04045 family)
MAEPTSRSSATASRPASTARLACRAVASPEELAAHFRIRHQVFVIEQGLFRSGDVKDGGWDRDVHDDDPATVHVVGLFDEVACGTVRLYPVPGVPGRWKGDRLAVLADHRHLGLGAPLVQFAVATASLRGGQEMEAYIQPANTTFFEWLGWRRTGGLVSYAGIPHQRMLIGLTRARRTHGGARRAEGQRGTGGAGG